jgi:hypothetical protein
VVLSNAFGGANRDRRGNNVALLRDKDASIAAASSKRLTFGGAPAASHSRGATLVSVRWISALAAVRPGDRPHP